jgi:hypothetical protein
MTPMPKARPLAPRAQLELLTWQPPTVIVPTIRIAQPDGSILLKAGKPVVVEESIGTAEAAAILGMTQRWVENECDLGHFTTAYKPGLKKNCRWKIARSEVQSRKSRPAD